MSALTQNKASLLVELKRLLIVTSIEVRISQIVERFAFSGYIASLPSNS